jgi:hypothetical protein
MTTRITAEEHRAVIAACKKADAAEKARRGRRVTVPTLWVRTDRGYEWPWDGGMGARAWDPFEVIETAEVAEYLALEAAADVLLYPDDPDCAAEAAASRVLADKFFAAATAVLQPYAAVIRRMRFGRVS